MTKRQTIIHVHPSSRDAASNLSALILGLLLFAYFRPLFHKKCLTHVPIPDARAHLFRSAMHYFCERFQKTTLLGEKSPAWLPSAIVVAVRFGPSLSPHFVHPCFYCSPLFGCGVAFLSTVKNSPLFPRAFSSRYPPSPSFFFRKFEGASD